MVGGAFQAEGTACAKAEGGAWASLPHWLWQLHREAGFLGHVAVLEHQRPHVFCQNPQKNQREGGYYISILALRMYCSLRGCDEPLSGGSLFDFTQAVISAPHIQLLTQQRLACD